MRLALRSGFDAGSDDAAEFIALVLKVGEALGGEEFAIRDDAQPATIK